MRLVVIQEDKESYEDFIERVDLRRGLLKLKYKTTVSKTVVGEVRGKSKNKDFRHTIVLRVHLKEDKKNGASNNNKG